MRNISTSARNAAYARETDQVFLVLLTISHNGLSQPIRVVNNTDDITSRGNLFVAYPFEITLAQEGGEQIPEVRLSISNVDRQIIASLRSLTSAPTCNAEIVLAASPDIVEVETGDLNLNNAQYNVENITATLSAGSFYGEPYPGDSFTRTDFPALF